MLARTPFSPTRLVVVAGATGVLLLTGACSSTQQLDSIETRLTQLQGEVTALQSDVASRSELEQLGEHLGGETAKLLRSDADLQADVQQLAQRIGELDSKLQDTLYRIDQISQQLAATNQDLRSLLSAGPADGEGPPPTPVDDPQALYEEAYGDYRKGNFDLAIQGFREYLDTYPDTDLADNALYWIGESRLNQGQYAEAIKEFSGVLARYPRSDRVPSAILRRAYAHLQLGERGEGIEQLRRLDKDYPSSEEATIAREQLEQLTRNGSSDNP